MRTKLTLAVAALVSLLVTGAAIAHERRDRSHTEVALANFVVNQVRASDKTCTGTDGEYRQFHAVYKGTSTGDSRLAREVWIKSHGVITRPPASASRAAMSPFATPRRANGTLPATTRP